MRRASGESRLEGASLGLWLWEFKSSSDPCGVNSRKGRSVLGSIFRSDESEGLKPSLPHALDEAIAGPRTMLHTRADGNDSPTTSNSDLSPYGRASLISSGTTGLDEQTPQSRLSPSPRPSPRPTFEEAVSPLQREEDHEGLGEEDDVFPTFQEQEDDEEGGDSTGSVSDGAAVDGQSSKGDVSDADDEAKVEGYHGSSHPAEV